MEANAEQKVPRIAVVGAGPAGLAAAETLAAAGVKVTIFERMPSAGRKFLMAGRGGLNLTHSEPLTSFLARYGESAPHLSPSITDYPPKALIRWAEGLGQETFVGTSGRVFPKSMKASPLLRAWLRRLEKLGVEIRTRRTWEGWSESGEPLFRTSEAVVEPFSCDAVVLALGGASWPRLGSDGGWVTQLSQAGIEITPLQPSNAGLTIAWSDVFRERFAGTPLKRIALTFEGKTQRGEAIVTSKGLEGGAVYALTSDISAATASGEPVVIHLDLRPDEQLDHIAGRLKRARGKNTVTNWLRKTLKLSLAAIGLLREAARALPGDPDELAHLIKHVPLTVTGTAGLQRAISTAGGVAFSAVDENLMLTARPGTFVAGEMLDWDAPTGGYLLQASIATGITAARGVLRFLKGAD